MTRNTKHFAAAFFVTLGIAAGAHATIMPMDSSFFLKKFEMNTPTGEVDPGSNTSTGEYTRSTSGTFTATLSGGALNSSTISSAGNVVAWTSDTWTALSSAASGWTIEIRVRVDATVGATDRGYQLFGSDGSQGTVLSIGKNATFIGHPGSPTALTLLSSADNSNGFHIFRIAKDAGASVFQVWRDGTQIGTNIGSSFSNDTHWFGDFTGDFGHTGAIDYLRWTTIGAYSPAIPEPASLALLLTGATCIFSRRRA